MTSKLMSTQRYRLLNPLNDTAMMRRILMVSAMILMLGSQTEMSAQKRVGPKGRRPAVEMRMNKRPGGPMYGKRICRGDVERIQDFYRRKYGIKLSWKEAEKILITEMRDSYWRKDYARIPDRRPYRR